MRGSMAFRHTANPALGFAATPGAGGGHRVCPSPGNYGSGISLPAGRRPRRWEKLVELIHWGKLTTRLVANYNILAATTRRLPRPVESLGAAAKGGTPPLAGVFRYGETDHRKVSCL